MNTDRRESACKDERGVKKTVNSGIWDHSHLKGISEVWHEHQSRDPLAHLHTTSQIDSILQIQTCAYFTRYFARIRSQTFLTLHMFNSHG